MHDFKSFLRKPSIMLTEFILAAFLPLCQWTRTNILCKWRTEVQKPLSLRAVYIVEKLLKRVQTPFQSERHTSFTILFFSFPFCNDTPRAVPEGLCYTEKGQVYTDLKTLSHQPVTGRKTNKSHLPFAQPSGSSSKEHSLAAHVQSVLHWWLLPRREPHTSFALKLPFLQPGEANANEKQGDDLPESSSKQLQRGFL